MRETAQKKPFPETKFWTIALPLLILLFYGLFLAHRIDLSIADLGRHLANGRTFLEDRTIWYANFYSYTAPDYPVMNHHWLIGLAFFLAWRAAGFVGVQLLFIAVGLAALFFYFRIAARETGPGPAAIAALLAIPLLAERTEIRPEAVSYLFAGVFFWLLLRYEKNSDWRPLLALPILEIVWVSSHIYFFLGPALVGVFLAGRALVRPFAWVRIRVLIWIFLAVSAATLINPSGFSGAAAPFTIFRNYGYRLAENQPVWFIERLISNPNFTIFKIAFALLAASFLFRAYLKKGDRASLPFVLIGGAVSALGWVATRNFALFGFFFIPLAGINTAAWCRPWLVSRQKTIAAAAGIIISLLLIPALFGQWQRYFPYWRQFGIGLEQGNSRAAEFFRSQGMKGPIFNNYDIGGYLIWHLFPEDRVFVDNRPEAYPADFFRDTYIPMQERDDAWRHAEARWHFNAIFFSHRDATPWGQQFLVARIADPEWAPVYADQYAIIFLKRNEENRATIERFEIPQNAFRIVTRTQ